MSVEVSVPHDFLSNVIADLNARRAQINNVEMRGHLEVVDAIAPLSELFGYSTQMRSLSQGRATYTMRFKSYQPVSATTYKNITGQPYPL